MWGKVPADGRLRKRREGSKNKEEGREDLYRRFDMGGRGGTTVSQRARQEIFAK